MIEELQKEIQNLKTQMIMLRFDFEDFKDERVDAYKEDYYYNNAEFRNLEHRVDGLEHTIYYFVKFSPGRPPKTRKRLHFKIDK
jgi:uncharacterized protein (UPF0305 family)